MGVRVLLELKFLMVTNSRELKDAYKVRETVFIGEQQVPKDIEMDEYDDKAIHFVVYQKELPIAAARIRPYQNQDIVKVERVAVLKEHRKTGIGKDLMNYIEHEARKMGYTKFRLHSQRHAERFYTKLGYITISVPFYEASIEHVTMEKEIEAL